MSNFIWFKQRAAFINRSTQIFICVTVIWLSFNTMALADQGITSSVHGKHVGEIVWSKKPIEFSSPEEASFLKIFTAADAIYGRVYQSKAINNYKAYNNDGETRIWDGGYEIHGMVDGKSIASSFGLFHDGKLSGSAANEWTTWRFSPYPKKPDQGFEQDIANKWIKAVRGLSAGNHKIRFEVWGTQGQYKTKQPMATGEFVLVIAAGAKIKNQATLPKDSYRGTDKFNLKQKMKQVMVGPVAKNSSEILAVSIPSNWKQGVYTKQIPRKEYRKISGVILWRDTNNDRLCRYTSYNFIQDMTGGTWSPLRFHGFCNGCAEGDVECPE